MTSAPRFLLALALAAMAAAPAHAASSAVASVSDSVSTSVDSVSRSIRRSSDSSSRTTVGQGDYQVIRVARADPGWLDVTLQPVADDSGRGDFTLHVAEAVAEQGALAVGRIVSVRERPYGLELSRADTRTAFLLLLTDDWYRELDNVVVTL